MALTTIQAVYDEARRALETGQDERAIGLSEHLLESFPHYLEAYRILGEAHLNRQNLEQAVEAFEYVLHSDPENIPVHVGLGVAYERQGQLQKAIQEFEQAFEIKPDLPELRNQVLRLYSEAWGNENAHVRLKKAGLARLYIRGNQYEKAIRELQDVLAQQPQRLDVQVALAEALWRNGQEQAAAEQARHILQSHPDVLKANLILGYVLLAAGNSEGKRLWSHAQQLDPGMGVAQTLFDGVLPPVEPIANQIETFDEPAWREKKARREQEVLEAQRREQQAAEEREQQERKAQAALVAEPAAVAADGSWLDAVESSTRGSAPAADDFLRGLLLGSVSTSPEVPQAAEEPSETDFDIDELGFDIEPFSFGDPPTQPDAQADFVVEELAGEQDNAEMPALPAFDQSDEAEDFGLDDLKPFSFDDLGDDLSDLPGMGQTDAQLPNQLQPFSLDEFETGVPAASAQSSAAEESMLPLPERPFSLDELSLEALESETNPGMGAALPPLPGTDEESGGFSWQEPPSRQRTLFGRRQEEEEVPPQDGSIFHKMIQKKQTGFFTPIEQPSTDVELDEETMGFFSHDDVPLRIDSDDEDIDLAPLPQADQTLAADETEPELTPFSLEDLGLSAEEIASFNGDAASDTLAVADQTEPELTPFSLEDLGLSAEEIASLNGDSVPDTLAVADETEPELTPFSLEDLGLSAEEIASLNGDSVPDTLAVADETEPELTPFSLEDLGLSAEEIASLNASEFPPQEQPQNQADYDFDEPQLTPFSLEDLGLSAGEIQSLDTSSVDDQAGFTEGDLEPFSMDNLPSEDTPAVSFDNLPEPKRSADAIFESLLQLGREKGFVDLTDIITCYDNPEEHAEEIDQIAIDLYQSGLAIHDGDEVIDMEEIAGEYEEELVADDQTELDLDVQSEDAFAFDTFEPTQPEAAETDTAEVDTLMPFSLEELGLSPEEIALLQGEEPISVEPEPETTVADQTFDESALMTPFSLAELGLSPEEIAALNGGYDAAESFENSAAEGDAEELLMQPFSFEELGLSADELATFDADQDGAITLDDFGKSDAAELPDQVVTETATPSDDEAALMQPFSLEELGLSAEEIAMFDADNDGAITPDDFGELHAAELPQLTQDSAGDAEELLMQPFSFEELGLSADELATFDADQDGAITLDDFGNADAAELPDQVVAETATPSDDEAALMQPFSLEELGLSAEEIAMFDADNDGAITPDDFGEPHAAELPQPTQIEASASQTDVAEMQPFSLEELGLSAEEIEELGLTEETAAPAQTDTYDFMPDVEPLSLEDLGLSDFDITESYDDERNLKLSEEELDSLDLALPVSESEPLIEPAPVWEATQAAIENVGAEEPSMQPFSLEDLGLSAEEIDSLDLGEAEASGASDGIETSEETAGFEMQSQAETFDPPIAEPATYEPFVEEQPSVTSQEPASEIDGVDLAEYRLQLEQEPTNHGLRIALARILNQTGEVRAALDEYKHLIKQGVLLDQVEEDLQDMINTHEDPALLQRLHRTLGDTYSKQSRWREAMDEYGWVLNKR